MKLFPNPIMRRMKSHPVLEGSYILAQKVIARFWHPLIDWEYFVIGPPEREPDKVFVIIKGFDLSLEKVAIANLEKTVMFNYPLERDRHFEPTPAEHVWNKLLTGEPI